LEDSKVASSLTFVDCLAAEVAELEILVETFVRLLWMQLVRSAVWRVGWGKGLERLMDRQQIEANSRNKEKTTIQNCSNLKRQGSWPAFMRQNMSHF
jgi:hypothetical protein